MGGRTIIIHNHKNLDRYLDGGVGRIVDALTGRGALRARVSACVACVFERCVHVSACVRACECVRVSAFECVRACRLHPTHPLVRECASEWRAYVRERAHPQHQRPTDKFRRFPAPPCVLACVACSHTCVLACICAHAQASGTTRCGCARATTGCVRMHRARAACECVRACVRACLRACPRACVPACLRACGDASCVRVCPCVFVATSCTLRHPPAFCVGARAVRACIVHRASRTSCTNKK